MKPEPLKGKKWYGTVNIHESAYKDVAVKSVKEPMFRNSDVKSAVEWLEEEDKKVHKELTQLLSKINAGLQMKIIGKLIKLDTNRKIAFEDVMK